MPRPTRLTIRALLPVSALALAACESSVSVDFGSASVPAEVLEVYVGLSGVDFRTDSGGSDTVRYDRVDYIDLVAYDGDNLLLLVDGEDIGDGRYSGVRPRFEREGEDDEEEARLVLIDGGEVELELGIDPPFADVDFRLEEDDGDDVRIIVALDLRLSLVNVDEDDDDEPWRLEPVMRAVIAEDRSRIEGRVAADLIEDCLDGDAEDESAIAMYLFEGLDVEPDDYDGLEADPIATASVVQGTAGYAYAFDVLPAGDYTIALTCDADEEDPQLDDDADPDDDRDDDDAFDFEQSENVSLDDGEVETVDFD